MKKKTLAILIPSGALAGILVLAFFGFLLKSGYKGELTRGLEQVAVSKKPAVHKRYQEVPKTIELKDAGSMYSDYDDGKKYRPAYADYRSFGTKMEEKRVFSLEGNKYAVVDSFTKGPEQTYPSGDGPVIVIQPTIPATGEGDKIIRTGFIKVEVENGKEAYNKALGICNELGGYMAGSNFYKTQEGKEAGTITMRIPKDKFTIALDKLSTLGKVENINTNSHDVSQEYTNLKSQLDAAMVVYNKMLEALQKRNVTIPDAVRLESELTPVLRRVEDLKNKIEYLNKSVAYTTVNFDFYESAVSFKTLKESRRFIQESMITAAIKAIKFIAVAIPVLIVAIILFGIAAVVGLAVKQWIKQLLKRG